MANIDYSISLRCTKQLDTRDLFKRKQWLEAKKTEADDAKDYAESITDDEYKKQAVLDAMEELDDDEQEELSQIEKIEEECSEFEDGTTLIDDDYFREYAEEYAEEIGSIKCCEDWPYNHINWDAAADELRNDYSEVKYIDTTYLVRD